MGIAARTPSTATSGASATGHGLLIRNTVLNMLGQALPLVVGIVTVPFVVRGLGPERFGILALAWVLLTYWMLFDLGLGRAVTKSVAEGLGGDGEAGVPGIVWTALAAQGVLGVVGAGVLMGVGPLLMERFLHLPAHLVPETERMLWMLALCVPVSLVALVLRAAVEATQRFDLVNAVVAPCNAIFFVMPLAGLSLGFGLPGIVGLVLLLRLGMALAFLGVALRVLSALRRSPAMRPGVLGPLLRYGAWITGANAVGPVIRYLDRFVLGAVGTLSAVTYYTVPYDVVERLWLVPGSLILTLFPALSALVVTDRCAANELSLRATKSLLVVVGPPLLLGAAYARPLLALWLGDEFAGHSTTALQILLVGTIPALLGPIPGALLQAAGRPELIPRLYLAYLAPSVAVLWFLVRTLGIAGAALTFALRCAADTMLLFWLCRRATGLSLAPPLAGQMVRAGLGLVALGVALALARALDSPYLEPVLVVLAVGGFVLYAWHSVLEGRERQALAGELRRHLPCRTRTLSP